MKLLLVEDEIEVSSFLIRGLRYEGYKIDHATTGEEAMKYINSDDYDIIILDLMLPTVSGEWVLKELRGQQKFTPVIVLTAIGEVDTKTKLLNTGADDYLVKPFSFVELIARIKSVLRRSKSNVQTSKELIVGEIKLNPSMRMVTRSGVHIKLRLKEFALLEYLMQNPDRVVTRNTLIENVWDYNAKLFSNTVDSHISLLRKKIDGGYDKKIIETIHGVGYILRSKAV